MVFKGILTAATAVALVAAPTVAMAQSAPAPAAETVSADSKLFGDTGAGGFIVPLFATVAFLLGLYMIFNDDEDDLPVSP